MVLSQYHITLMKPLKTVEGLFFVSIVVVYDYIMVSESVVVIIFCNHETEGKTRHWLERYHFVVSTLALGLKINFDQPIRLMEFQ